MSYQACILEERKNYKQILSLLESETDEECIEIYSTFRDLFLPEDEIIEKSKMKEILYMISKITNNHHRHQNFYKMVEQIFFILKDCIKQQFTDIEIFNIFRNNKRMLLFLFDQEIIEINIHNKESIIKYFETKTIKYKISKSKKRKNNKKRKTNSNSNSNKPSFILFFYPEIKRFIGENKKKLIEDNLTKIDSTYFENFEQFNKKRHEGENDSYICSLIRSDLIEEFCWYINKNNISLTSKINPSIYETNSFLIKKEPTLIEYAAFFGSIQIIQFLKYNKVPLTSSLWLYSIHSKNAEIIHFLEENEVKPNQNKTNEERFEKVFIESIKCHHNDIAEYIRQNLFEKITDLNEHITSYIFRYHNNCYFPNEINRNDFIYLCQFDYLEIVKNLQKENKIDKKDIIST